MYTLHGFFGMAYNLSQPALCTPDPLKQRSRDFVESDAEIAMFQAELRSEKISIQCVPRPQFQDNLKTRNVGNV